MAYEMEISRVIADVFQAMLGWDAEALADQFQDERASSRACFSGCVHIVGDWNGMVVINLPEPLAYQAAAAMLARRKTDLLVEDVQDVIGELANMIGGNIKALVPGSCRLSLPSVVFGQAYRVICPSTDRISCLDFKVQENVMNICLFKSLQE